MGDNGQIWEVVGNKGIVARVARELASPAFEQRLSAGSLVREAAREGDRLRYDRIAGTGYGPDSGWVSVRAGNCDLLVPVDFEPPKGGWKVLHKELPATWSRPALPAPPALPALEGPVPAGPGGHPGAQYAQTAGQPFAYYRQVNFADTKPTGLRMSACLGAMDECRWDSVALCDHTVESYKQVTSPFTQVVIEMRPAVRQLAEASGLGDPHPESKQGIRSWLRLEAQFGWPMFPVQNEETTVYLVGKHKGGAGRVPICTARFTEIFVDDSTGKALEGPQWTEDTEKFWKRVKDEHSIEALNELNLYKMYPAAGKAFAPTRFQKVSWPMSAAYADLWAILYHARTPEILWEINRLAGGPFAQLTDGEADPQAMAMDLPKKMQLGVVYDAHCFLDEATRKAVYVLLPENSSDLQDCVLCVLGLYDWQSTPADGGSLSAEDVELVRKARPALVSFGVKGEKAKPTRLLDLSKVVAGP